MRHARQEQYRGEKTGEKEQVQAQEPSISDATTWEVNNIGKLQRQLYQLVLKVQRDSKYLVRYKNESNRGGPNTSKKCD